MRKIIRIIAIVLTVCSALLSLTYLALLALSYVGTLPVSVAPNVLFRDWVFMAIPILGLLTGILLQVASLTDQKRKHK